MVIIKAKGEYYCRELERLENECDLSPNERAEIKCRKKRLKDSIENGLVRNFRSMFTGGKLWICWICEFLYSGLSSSLFPQISVHVFGQLWLVCSWISLWCTKYLVPRKFDNERIEVHYFHVGCCDLLYCGFLFSEFVHWLTGIS